MDEIDAAALAADVCDEFTVGVEPGDVVECSLVLRTPEKEANRTRLKDLRAEFEIDESGSGIVAEARGRNVRHDPKFAPFDDVMLSSQVPVRLGNIRGIRLQRNRTGDPRKFKWDEGTALPERMIALTRDDDNWRLVVTPTVDGTLTNKARDAVKLSFLVDVYAA